MAEFGAHRRRAGDIPPDTWVFVPATEQDAETVAKMRPRIGEPYSIEAKQPRNGKQHRWYRQLLVSSAAGLSNGPGGEFWGEGFLHDWHRINAGHVSIFRATDEQMQSVMATKTKGDPNVYLRPKSTAFHRMDQSTADWYIDAVAKQTTSRLLDHMGGRGREQVEELLFGVPLSVYEKETK